ncbi:TonB-dependent receptor [Dysgonomonas sp. Marseille-P4677]|uniref:outer membrane beta-barrel family protein n=1 Tax=Dysgonomonas sp. Marseille-P4677 TaxID=2364790 RepID=UPI0019140238|nr:outer membrane beta-barrel family protein [Dysgonomonas sp. Marseille-P4677]MBK5721890.1 TonB-dependent receptor [Dysgonomonas sp. Marseille-P4677]
MKIHALLIALFIGVFSSISAQTSTNINNVNVLVKGQVLDSLTNETIPFATIKITDKGNPAKLLKAAAADENGKFQLTINQKGDFLFISEYIGKKTVTKPIEIGNAKTVDMGTVLMPDDAHALSEVVVSVQKPLVKVDLDKITYSMEDDPESKTNNVLDMLKKVPMVTVDGEENIQLKGSSSYKIYLNGKPSNMIASNPKDVLRSMPASSIKDIEVITDPGAKYDAEGVAGIINIITQKNTSMGGYTATLNGRVDDLGGFGSGAYLQLKYGKIGFTGGYNYYQYKSPKGESSSFREDFVNNDLKYLSQNGFSKYDGNGQYGNGELSFEIDTLNLINVGFNRYFGDGKSTNEQFVEMLNNERVSQYRYNLGSHSKQNYGGTDVNVDYQRTFKKKDQLLTASYRFSFSPNDSESDNIINQPSGTIPEGAITNNQFTDADMKEHTFQTDFVTPFGKIHNVEAGIKYIIRLNQSNSGYDFINDAGEWVNKPQLYDKFKHEQDILAAYGGYSAKFQKWGVKTGLRYEATWLEAKFPIDQNKNFKKDYSNLVPSATITYQLKPTQNIRLGYNMRIQRPGIYQLNPYENTSNPNYVQKGNSELDAVKNHSFSLNFGSFSKSLNFNANLSYDFENDGIESITTLEDSKSTTTYMNIGERKNWGLSGYVNWSPNDKIRIYSNMSGRYVDLKSSIDPLTNKRMSNNGFSGNIFAGGQYSFPYNFKSYLNTGYFSPWISLQGKGASFFFHSISFSKGFMNDRLQLRAYAQNPLKKENEFKNTISTDNFYSESFNSNRMRQFGFSVSFRFGEMKAQIKKAQRGINNDDNMGGGQENQGGQQGGQGGGQN